LAKKAPPSYEIFIKEQREKGISRERDFGDISPNKLNSEQLRVYSAIEDNLRDNRGPIRLILIGEGGTGKSYLSIAIKTLLKNYGKSCLFASYTGASAFVIGEK